MTREEAIEYLVGMDIESLADGLNEAVTMAIESLQTELVRCKDCKWHMNDYMGEWCGMLVGHPSMKANDFCSYGERRI